MTTAILKAFTKTTRSRHLSKTQTKSNYVYQVFTTVASLAAVDAVTIMLVVFAAFAILSSAGIGTAVTSTVAAAFSMTTVAAFFFLGVYKPGVHPVYETRQSLVAIGSVAVLALSHLSAAGLPWTPAFVCLPFFLVAPLVRAFARSTFAKTSWWGVPFLLYGADRRIQTLFAKHQKNASRGLVPAGFLQDRLSRRDISVAEHFLGTPHRTKELGSRVSCALVHRRGRTDNEIQKFIDSHLRGFARIVILPDDARLPSLWSMGGAAGISIEDNLLRPSSTFAKRTVDVAIAGAALIVGSPLFAGLAIWNKVTSPGPVFFGHTRISKNGKRFKVWKFRSMVTNAEEVLQQHLEGSAELREEWETTQKLKNDPRVTACGRFLRKTSLDELPQLWNVLVGDMSLVGPRPIVENEIEKYEDTFDSYLRVRPGITGFWQVSGRNLTTYERRVELDEFYVRNWSIWFDLYILVRTVKTVLLREGAF